MEKVYRAMKSTGISNLVIGICLLTAAATAGIFLIISGARLLKRKNEMTF